MTANKDSKNVNTKPKTKQASSSYEVVYLPGTEKELQSIALKHRIRLQSILHSRIAHGIEPGVPVERLKGAAAGKKLNELKIKSSESFRCFYSVRDGLLLVAIVFAKKQEGQANKELKVALQRLRDYEMQKK